MTRGYSPSPLPPSLHDRAYTVREARDAGVTARRLRALDLDRRVYGVRDSAATADAGPSRLRLLAARMPPGAFFSHETAADLLGAPLPYRRGAADVVHVSVERPARAPHASGLRGHSRVVLAGDVRVTAGVRHSSPERMWLELSRSLSLPDLVAVGDHLIGRRRPLTSIERLAERNAAADALARSRRATRALALLDGRAESGPESLLRVLLVSGGLPSPDVNHVVVQSEAGRGIRTDFAYPHLKLAIEYQGDYHRSRAQWRADMTRRSRLEALGWYVLELNADDLRNPAELLARIRAVLRRRGAQLPDRAAF